MEIKELRIGNWINDFSGKRHKITSIRFLELGIGTLSIEARYASPILLTESVLLSLGFEKIGSNFEIENMIIHTHIKSGEFHFLLNEPRSGKTIVTNLIYLHQLQNLYFSLFNKELI